MPAYRDPESLVPFRGWIADQRAGLPVDEDAPEQTLVTALGWDLTGTLDSGLRRLRRWEREQDQAEWLDIYEALSYADAAWWELYPHRSDRPSPGRVDRGRVYVCDEDVLVAAHSMHLDGMSVRQVARELFDDCFSASPKSLANAFFNAFHQRGWEVRGRSEATALSNVQRAFRPRCSHVHRLGERRGEQCARRCVGNNDWCWKHNPDRIAAGIARARSASTERAAA